MNDNQKIEQSVEENEEIGAKEYLNRINELKLNSVPKEKYEKALEDNKILAEAVLNGASVDAQQVEKPIDKEKRIAELRDELFGEGGDLSNLDYWKDALELRNLVKETTGEDIFVASNDRLTPTDYDYQCADRVADVVQQCIDGCNNNSSVFTTMLDERTKEVKLPNKK